MKSGILFVLIASFVLGGCATTNRTKTLVGMIAGGAVGSAVGYLTAPQGTDPAMHSSYWGLAGAAAMGVAGLFLFDEQKKSSDLERQVEGLKKEIAVYRSEGSTENASQVQGTPQFPKEIPAPLKGLVEPGKWTYIRNPANTWRWTGSHSVVRECERFEFIPPRLKVGSFSSNPAEGGVQLSKEGLPIQSQDGISEQR